jgi:molybdopterin/thiamine biosynthesis adenylyltransferase
MGNNRVLLTEVEKTRYNRQIILPGWGEEGQRKIKQATVFIAGAGGLGSPVAIYLAAAGIGCLRICDCGEPELSNLNRQILHTDKDIGKKKVHSAKETLSKINPHVHIISLPEKIERENISQLVADSQIMIDCLDNFETRYILNEYAVKTGLPFLHAGVYGMSGQMTFIHSPETPCLQCIFPQMPSPEIFPVVGATPGVIGSLEALEALKYLVGQGTCLKKRLLIWEGDIGRFEEIAVEKNPACPVCGKKD